MASNLIKELEKICSLLRSGLEEVEQLGKRRSKSIGNKKITTSSRGIKSYGDCNER